MESAFGESRCLWAAFLLAVQAAVPCLACPLQIELAWHGAGSLQMGCLPAWLAACASCWLVGCSPG